MEGDINQGIAYYKKALYYNWHYADAMYNLGVAYGEMLKFDMVSDSWGLFFSLYPNKTHVYHLCLFFIIIIFFLFVCVNCSKNLKSYNHFLIV